MLRWWISRGVLYFSQILPNSEGVMLRIYPLTASLAAALCLYACTSRAQLPQPNGGSIERGSLPVRWLSEQPKCKDIPEWQVHAYNPNFFILRQSPCTDFEKPFVFLLFGKDKALLIDTGSRNGNLAPAVNRTVKSWLAHNARTSIPLIVAHTHEHEDHVWGDRALLAMNDPVMPITFVPSEVEATQKFFGIKNWPTRSRGTAK
jgi:hydroxyacylglutathione hydrolase